MVKWLWNSDADCWHYPKLLQTLRIVVHIWLEKIVLDQVTTFILTLYIYLELLLSKIKKLYQNFGLRNCVTVPKHNFITPWNELNKKWLLQKSLLLIKTIYYINLDTEQVCIICSPAQWVNSHKQRQKAWDKSLLQIFRNISWII